MFQTTNQNIYIYVLYNHIFIAKEIEQLKSHIPAPASLDEDP